jgi:hypothetical protein
MDFLQGKHRIQSKRFNIFRPWWTLSQTQCSRHLKAIERQYTAIREEALNAWNEDNDRFVDEDPHITSGTQKALHLRIDHAFNEKNCLLTPTICQLLKEFADESKCDKGNVSLFFGDIEES